MISMVVIVLKIVVNQEQTNIKMKCVIIIFVAIMATEALSDKETWENFKINYSRNYQNIAEEKQRYNIFLSNLLRIKEHNDKYENGQSSYTMGVNKFADLTPEEFVERMKYSKNSKPNIFVEQAVFDLDGDLPAEVDWTKKGAVTEVKDQAQCGSCWSFSTTGTVESQNFIKTGKLVSLSEQQLVDCVSDDCFGCGGGYMDKALEYIVANGIMLEGEYPYEAQDDTCRYNKSDIAVQVKSYKYVKANDELELQKAVALNGPIAVAICASWNFQLYQSGILNDTSCGNLPLNLNHGVLATGYGSQDGKDYWIVKNSWGADWGMNGYLWMSRNADNQCGIATEPVFPEM